MQRDPPTKALSQAGCGALNNKEINPHFINDASAGGGPMKWGLLIISYCLLHCGGRVVAHHSLLFITLWRQGGGPPFVVVVIPVIMIIITPVVAHH